MRHKTVLGRDMIGVAHVPLRNLPQDCEVQRLLKWGLGCTGRCTARQAKQLTAHISFHLAGCALA